MNIVRLSIPTPFYVGDVNVYLIKEDPLTLVDTGPKTATAERVLRARLRQNGVRFADIKRVILTHAHEDHCGLAARIRSEGDETQIYVHPWESGHLFGGQGREAHRDLLYRAGVPAEIVAESKRTYAKFSLLTDPVAAGEFKELHDGHDLEFENGVLRVLHTPGHTPGSCSLVREADRTMLCGDCVLKRITPNPIVSPDPTDRDRRFKSLGEYLVSLARIRSYSPTLIYGGHGEPINDFEAIFNRYVRAIDERQRKVIAAVAESGSSAWDVAQVIFPDAVGKEVHRFLAVSESVAHLDHAESEGRIGVELREGVEVYVPR